MSSAKMSGAKMMLSRDQIDQAGRRHVDRLPAAGGALSRRLDGSIGVRQVAVWSAIAALATALTGPMARQWMTHALANVCVLGGIVGAPCISILAWVGMVLPTRAPLHAMAPSLMTGALIWLGLAIVGAHAFRLDRHDDTPAS